MKDPNFFVVGAGRSGTTSLHEFLGQHPDVFMCRRKSPNFFASHVPQPMWETPAARAMARQWVGDRDTYRALFSDASTERAVGEVSPVYLQALEVPDLVHAAYPQARVVAVLREPVERAFAHFVGRRRDGIETFASFDERVRFELSAPFPDDVAFGHVLGCGRYHHFLRPYVERFGPERVKVLLHDDLVARPQASMAELFEFLDVDPGFVPDTSARLNRTGVIRRRPARVVWTRSVRLRTALRPHLPSQVRSAVGRRFLAGIEKPELDQTLRRRLGEVFREEIGSLEVLLDRDLSCWRAG